MTNSSKYDDDLKKAKIFFEKKLEKNNFNSESIKGEKFRDLDDETVTISKLSARIESLKKSLVKKKREVTRENVIKKTKKKKEEKKFFSLSKKNKDINGSSLRNYFSDEGQLSRDKYIMSSDFEINGRLYIAGNINKIPSDTINILIKDGFIKEENNFLKKKSIGKESFFVKETYGLSEIKRSKLRNKKNLDN